MTEPGQMFSDGKTYERMMGRWSKLAGRIFLDWLDPPKNLNWIEVGCGNGAFTEELIARCAPRAVSAVDPSPGQLDFARTRPAAKLAQFSRGGGIVGTTDPVPGAVAGGRSSDGAWICARRCVPRGSELTANSASSARLVAQAKRKSHSGDVVRTAPAI